MKLKIFTIYLISIISSCSNFDGTIKKNITIEKHNLDINFDIANRLIHIKDQLSFKAVKPIKTINFLINNSVVIEQIKLNNSIVNFNLKKNISTEKYFDKEDSNATNKLKNAAELIIDLNDKLYEGIIQIKYQLTPTDVVDNAAFSREYIAYEVTGYIGNQGIFISPAYYWYPDIPSNLAKFQVNISCPDSIHIITQGELTNNSVQNSIRNLEWQIKYPADGLHLVGSKYIVDKTQYKNIDIYTFFFPNTKGLAQSYLDACVGYLAMYEELIGPYPFKKFAVVENFFPTGYGMPSYTLLGSQVIRLPFIIHTSLGHEIAHNWWGNSVYVDYQSGNWCEGLTTYFADYFYKEKRSLEEASAYRRDINRDFTVYVKGSKDIPLCEFKERTESASRAVGYGKSAMVFHQLRRLIGDSLFWASFKDFYQSNIFHKASWKDIQQSIQKVSGQDLNWFFEQWIQKKGIPNIRLSSKRYNRNILFIEIEQSEPLFKVQIPITIHTHHGNFIRLVDLSEKRQGYMFLMDWVPRTMTIDPEFDVFRKLDKNEIPPTLSEIFAKDSIFLIIPDQCSDNKFKAYQKLVDMLVNSEKKYSVKQPDAFHPTEEQAIIILGDPAENSFYNKVSFANQTEVEFSQNQILLHKEVKPNDSELVVLALRDKKNENRNFGVIAIGSLGISGRVGSLIKHYGKYSYLVFTEGKNSVKETYSVIDSTMSVRF
jgi:hypothetical protein